VPEIVFQVIYPDSVEIRKNSLPTTVKAILLHP
jgi:hypothetical protein